nr:immunoglobulin heavy chain junction region [Mus musculus]
NVDTADTATYYCARSH